MKTLIHSMLLLLAGALLLASCQEDEREERQRTEIESYIRSTLRAEVNEVDGVYIVWLAIDTVRAARGERIAIHPGDDIGFLYEAVALRGGAFATNVPEFAAERGLVPLPMEVITVGSSRLITGLDRGLRHLSLGDHALILFPFTLGYGEENVGSVPAESALLFEVIVTMVNGTEFPVNIIL